jgi:large subunit ribosomal protein L6
MPVTGMLKTELKLPKGVTVKYEGGTLIFRGKEGEVVRRPELGRIKMSVGESISLTLDAPRRRELAVFNTIVSELKSAMEGAMNGFEYRLKIVYAHFPIKVQVKGNTVVIENFLGERYPRYAAIVGSTKVTVSGDIVTVRSADLEADGIYIIEKAGKVLVA